MVAQCLSQAQAGFLNANRANELVCGERGAVHSAHPLLAQLNFRDILSVVFWAESIRSGYLISPSKPLT